MRDLTGKVAWITGAGTGIGEAGAKSLAALGMNIVLSGRRPDPLKAVADAIGECAVVEPLDVTDKARVDSVATGILDRFGSCDVLVNSAGLNASKDRHWHNFQLDGWDQVIDVDLNGAFYCSMAVLPSMKEKGEGLVINISSWAGKYTSILTGPAYSAAKHAMISMTESFNMENGIHGIRACAICPGEVDTPILDNRPVPVSPEERAKMVQSEECGEIIAFIARLPSHVCVNELTVSPTWNRSFVERARALTEGGKGGVP